VWLVHAARRAVVRRAPRASLAIGVGQEEQALALVRSADVGGCEKAALDHVT
jgi:hypothetical protein